VTLDTLPTVRHHVGDMGRSNITPGYLEKIDRLEAVLLTETAHVTVWQVHGDTAEYMTTVMSPWAAEARGLERPWSCQCAWYRKMGDTWRPCPHGMRSMLNHAELKGIDFGQGIREQTKGRIRET